MSEPISIVIPAYNEELAIEKTVRTIQEVLTRASITHEIIVVDDGSADATAPRARAAGALVFTHPINAGYGKSLKDGIKAARYDLIGITDADLTYPVDQFPVLIQEIEKGFDMAVGARHGKYYRGSLLKMPARIIFRLLVEFTTGKHIPDINSGLRVLKKKHVLQFEPIICDGFSFTTTITLAYLMNGLFVSYLPIPYHKRVGKSKIRIVRDTLRTTQIIIEAIAYFNPLKLFLLLACILVCMGIVLLILGIILNQNALIYAFATALIAGVITFAIGAHAAALKK